MGFKRHLMRFIPELAQTAAAVRPLAKNTKRLIDWKQEYKNSFNNILKLVSEITQNKHFDEHLDIRIVCDASTTGSGASLEQNSAEG